MISIGKTATIHYVFSIYDRLFGHIEKEIWRLRRKHVTWKVDLLRALEAAKAKLQEYYSKT